jgi:hypothetical protein
MCDADQNVPQPKTSGGHSVPQSHKAKFEVAKWFMEAMVFTETLWGLVSNGKCLMVEHALQLAIDAQDSQQASADTPGVSNWSG